MLLYVDPSIACEDPMGMGYANMPSTTHKWTWAPRHHHQHKGQWMGPFGCIRVERSCLSGPAWCVLQFLCDALWNSRTWVLFVCLFDWLIDWLILILILFETWGREITWLSNLGLETIADTWIYLPWVAWYNSTSCCVLEEDEFEWWKTNQFVHL